MKTALLFSGNPRFSADFDSQIENLQNSDVDWYVTFWNRDFGWDPKISENWCNLKNAGDIRDRLKPHLPPNHKIKFVEILDPNFLEPIPGEYPPFRSNPSNVWQQYKCLQYCYRWCRELDSYDLIVRSRTDLGLSEPIDLKLAHESLIKWPNTIFIPNNQRYGYEPNFNDQFAIGLPHVMDYYCNAVDTFDELHKEGTEYNPEYLVQTALTKKGVMWPPTSFEIIRGIEHWQPIDHGKWDKI